MTCLIDIKDYDESFLEKIKEAENKISMSDKYAGDKILSLCGRVLLGYMLKRDFDLDFFCYRYGEHEKPYLENEDIFFNISHSDTLVLCSVDRSEVGCDVQKLQKYNPRVAARFFTEKETALIEKSEDKSRAFIKLWVLKESILKKNGTGISGGLDSYDFSDYLGSDDFEAYGCRFSCFSQGDCEIAVCSEKVKQSFEFISKEELESYMDGIKL